MPRLRSPSSSTFRSLLVFPGTVRSSQTASPDECGFTFPSRSEGRRKFEDWRVEGIEPVISGLGYPLSLEVGQEFAIPKTEGLVRISLPRNGFNFSRIGIPDKRPC